MNRQWTRLGVTITLLAASCALGDTWTITTSDFHSRPIELLRIDDSGVTAQQDGRTVAIAIDRLVRLERAASAAPAAPFVVHLSGRQSLTGRPVAMLDQILRWENPTLGRLDIPIRVVRLVRRSGGPVAGDEPPSGEDVVTLVNGDTVRGILAGIVAQTVSVQQPDGQTLDVPLSSVVSIVLAASEGDTQDGSRSMRVTLADGSVILALGVASEAGRMSVRLADQIIREVSLAMVVAIEQVNGPVVWLSDLPPRQSIHTPFLELSWPARMGRSVDGQPIRWRDRRFAHGIGVHSYSRLVWQIDPSFRAFRTQYAIADDLPYASVAVRIKLDDRVVHEQPDFGSGMISQPVIVELDGAKTLTLEVDFGRNYDVQDRLNWIEAAFVRTAATQPAE